jgi:arsenical pump membrane protein
VIYASQMPPLAQWLPRFALPSAVAILATYGMLRFTQREALTQSLTTDISVPKLSTAGRAAAWGIVLTALVLMTASARGWQLGLPTCIAGIATLALVSGMQRVSPLRFLHDISWGVIPLVAGLFVLVAGLEQSGAIGVLSESLHTYAQQSPRLSGGVAGLAIGFVCNLVNNLPAGLIAGTAVQAAAVPPNITSSILIGVDLGPNLSVTGSLATILWLTALRREGIQVRARDFLQLGLLIMPPALLLALAATASTW